MCADIAQAVATARTNGLQATEPKLAIQGGQIARIVEPLDGVAVAFMQPGPRRGDSCSSASAEFGSRFSMNA